MELWKHLIIFILRIVRSILDIISDIIYKWIYEGKRKIKFPQIEDEILLLPAVKLAEKIRKRELTSFQVTMAFIKRIQDVNGIINAVVDNR